MSRTIAIGIQNFEEMIIKNVFYVDKTHFIKEWWESEDSVTLISRPRRFGKTLNMNMLETFFSVEYANRGDLFQGLSIWNEEKYQKLQGTYPVISISFANIKEREYITARRKINQILTNLYIQFIFLRESDVLTEKDKEFFDNVSADMSDDVATMALHQLSNYLYRYYGKKVIILLDEYDTPMQEAYLQGFWDDFVSFTRSLFNSTFKTNPYLEKGIMTGITRVSKESVFSDLNNLQVVTVTSDKYATCFGFTEEEVFVGLEECHLISEKTGVKFWYDGFLFGTHTDIYNPWSILNFLDTGKYDAYWANTSSNTLVGKLIREGNRKVKTSFEILLQGESISCPIEEQISYNQLGGNESAIWSLLLASGYLKVIQYEQLERIAIGKKPMYKVALTNHEVKYMFLNMVQEWFYQVEDDYSDFITAFMLGDKKAMNVYMNRLTLQMFSYFDTVKGRKREEPERFYHGFVLGLLAELNGRYIITSNRESGFGRYDVMLEPQNREDNAYILEFKVHDKGEEVSLKETVDVALQQIEDKKYETVLISKGIAKDRIYKYGFAFDGKQVLIG
ncbi:MAG: AAA family ATPase [Lachnospiraceae bacterium]|nr:AAA family ATPase [Lachnospiraceae bacterium]